MESLNKIFSLKKAASVNPDEPAQVKQDEGDEVQVRMTYFQSGFGASQKAMGQPLIFRASLETVYESFEEQCRKLKEEQRRLKQPFIEEKHRQESELKNAETALSIGNDRLEAIDGKIGDIKFDIENVKGHPEKYGLTTTKQPHALFYIGLFLLIPITIYLFVFYISATYSAFFKTFSDDSLSAAIFDAQALNIAMQEGLLEGILVVTIPSVFLGLGYIIHMVQKDKGIKNMIRLGALFLLTFLFDGLLAYQIEKKIYDFNKTLETAPYNLKIALGEAEFWMIIFAGFVVYIIWGLIFDLVMKEYENIDKIKAFIRSKQQELARASEQKATITLDNESIRQRISGLKGKIEELQSKIDGFVLNVKQYLLYHNQYKEGWFRAIYSELNFHTDKKDSLIEQCEAVSNEHLEKLNLLQPNHQHIVYSRIS